MQNKTPCRDHVYCPASTWPCAHTIIHHATTTPSALEHRLCSCGDGETEIKHRCPFLNRVPGPVSSPHNASNRRSSASLRSPSRTTMTDMDPRTRRPPACAPRNRACHEVLFRRCETRARPRSLCQTTPAHRPPLSPQSLALIFPSPTHCPHGTHCNEPRPWRQGGQRRTPRAPV